MNFFLRSVYPHWLKISVCFRSIPLPTLQIHDYGPNLLIRILPWEVRRYAAVQEFPFAWKFIAAVKTLLLYRIIVIYASYIEYISSYPKSNFIAFLSSIGGRDSSEGIATRYGLHGPGIESRWRRDFPHPSRPTLRPTQPPVQWVPGLSWG